MISNTADAQQRALPAEETFISKFSTMSSLHSHCRNVTGEESFLLNLTGKLFFIDYQPVKPLKTTKNQQRPASSQLSTFSWSCRASLCFHHHICTSVEAFIPQLHLHDSQWHRRRWWILERAATQSSALLHHHTLRFTTKRQAWENSGGLQLGLSFLDDLLCWGLIQQHCSHTASVSAGPQISTEQRPWHPGGRTELWSCVTLQVTVTWTSSLWYQTRLFLCSSVILLFIPTNPTWKNSSLTCLPKWSTPSAV